MDLSDLPQFTIESIRQDGSDVVMTGRLSHLRGVCNDRGWVFRSGRPAIIGTLSRVPDSPDVVVEFRSPEVDLAPELTVGIAYPWVDGYWQAYQIAAILAGQWEPRTFATKGASDHEHCELCWEHIGGTNSPLGFADPENHWLCPACYHRYAVPRDVSFAIETSR